ncbi:RDD family protein [Streptodolium elevatio]|uniref:RDD family protein n=1 Tax=Streptodolium elevatio TaxID=3157996 RepID=A0ABV3DJU1_9ACTN
MSFSPPPGPAPQSHPGYGQAGAPGYGPPADIANWYAPWGTRVSATFIDGLISLLFTLPFEIASRTTDQAALGVLGTLVGFGWFIYQMYLQGTTGATIGKKQMGIRVVRESDGQVTGFGMAVVRGLAHILDALTLFLGFLWPLWDTKKQTFADKVCGTLVIKSR